MSLFGQQNRHADIRHVELSLYDQVDRPYKAKRATRKGIGPTSARGWQGQQ